MTVGEVTKNLPWVEKYRPSKLEDLVSHDDIVKTINQFMNENQLPHLLFYGPPGTGKTSTILACAKKMYTPQQFNSMVLELNASDDRGIGIVRGQILSFASTRTIFKAGPKLIILDEADAMTNDAQNALRRNRYLRVRLDELAKLRQAGAVGEECERRVRAGSEEAAARSVRQQGGPGAPASGQTVRRAAVRVATLARQLQGLRTHGRDVIEKYTENVRFCIICNYLGKIIPALQSRCTRFRFAPLNQAQIVPRLREIAHAEGVQMSEDGLSALLALSGGDMRKVLNTLQSTWLAYRDVTEDHVYTCVGHPLRSDVNSIVNWLLNENDFAASFKHIQDLKLQKGLALSDILTEVHTIIQRLKLPPAVLISLLIKMCDAEARLAGGGSERVELAALIAAFQRARDEIKVDA